MLKTNENRNIYLNQIKLNIKNITFKGIKFFCVNLIEFLYSIYKIFFMLNILKNLLFHINLLYHINNEIGGLYEM